MSSTAGPIIVGYDESDAARAALRWAVAHAEAVGARIRIVYVSSQATELAMASVQINTDPIHRDLEARLDDQCTKPLTERGLDVSVQMATGGVAHELMRIAHAEEAAVIVIGMTERGILGDLISSTTEHTLRRHAVRPVVAVPAAWLPTDTNPERPDEQSATSPGK